MTAAIPPSTPPRILHVVLSMVVGGAEKLVHDMVRYPAFAGTRPLLCCLDSVGELGERLRGEGYMVFCRNRGSGLDLSIILWLRDIIRNEKIDIVHAHQYTPLFYSVPAALLGGRVKVVYTEHGRLYPERHSWKRQLFGPLLACGVDHLVSISASTAQAMARYDNLPLRRIKIIHNGVTFSRMAPAVDQLSKRQELGLPDTCRIIGTAARLEAIKNIQMMLKVLQLVLLSVPDTCLVIAGQGSEAENLKKIADTLGIADKVKFIGLRFDMPEIYPLMDIFLLTSHTEGISVTLLEAMASGLPAVVTDVGGNREVMREGVTGYLTPVAADSLMAQRVVELLTDRFLARKLGQNGRERVHSLFSFDGMMKSYQDCYRGLFKKAAIEDVSMGSVATDTDTDAASINVGTEARKGIAWSGVAQIAKYGLDFGVGIILARLLTPKEFGVVSASMVFLSFITILTSFGFSAAIIQRPDLDNDYIATAQTVSVALGVFSTALLALSAHWIGDYYNNPAVGEVIPVMAIMFLISAFSMVPTALLTRKLQYHKITALSIIGSITYGATSIAIALAGFGVWSLVVGPIAGMLVGAVLLSLAASYMPRFGFKRRYLQELLNFGGYVTLSSLLNNVARNADNFIVGRFLGLEALGFYARAYNLATIPKEILVTSFGSVLFPSFALIQKDNERIANAYFKSVHAIALVSLPISGFLVVAAPEFVQTIYGPKWSGSIVPLQILGFAGFIYSLYIPCTSLLLGLGKVRIYSILQVVYSAAIVLAVVFFYRNGIVCIASAVAVVITACYATYSIAVQQVLKTSLNRYWLSMKTSLIATTVMTISLLAIKTLFILNIIKTTYTCFLLEVIISVLAYLLFITRYSSDEIVDETIDILKMKFLPRRAAN